ncbi:helix-turn-helix domain-containing protein [Mycobacterium intracellulare]|uniref:AraC family transcriptional regulator n=1 Tax=Mycobacterium intracellulare TaxID=1767 RepID=A0AAE4RL24_MYCIT|nr:helix-turn-helix domain-containing protein [Mycobacterium intracellulare]MDV6980174.1 AraC family transcriptional regulator [Mycobacterium intracellulare]MDV6985802.1 AraC family transcriptional regulator [Mycobacterium intracellulare]MDV7016208.1 AraC family transcriptional regulator [Mycobacterium intracellulare]MDV7031085.1 AraC family transcriptional regulator [Mycobacterium intracellulare]
MRERSGLAVPVGDVDPRVTVRSLDDFAEVRTNPLESSGYWWPDIGPLGGTSSFSFTHRMRRLGPITVLDVDFHDAVWVNGGEIRPHYHVTLPVVTSSVGSDSDFAVAAAPGSVAVYRPEGKAGLSGYVGRLLAVMIDRHAVEDALADALGHPITSQVDLQPMMPTASQAVRSWITLVSQFTEQLFRPRSILHQPMVGMPFAESVVRGLLLATDHSYRAALEDEATDPAPIRAAIDVIESEAHLPLTISALAARSYVSVRSLQQGFRAHVGTTPMAYLREVRLRRAHHDLQVSDPSVDTVASIALRWGFANFGRFAAAYAARYGERPFVTLRRPANDVVSRSRYIA